MDFKFRGDRKIMEAKVHKDFLKNNKIKKCLVCNKTFKLGEIIWLVTLQEPKYKDEIINSIAIPIHYVCHFKEK